MRILYGVQGTGHGHINRAKVIIPILQQYAEVEVLLSGYNFNLDLDINFKRRGISLTYNSRGGIDLFDTAISIKPIQLMQDIQSVPVNKYDFVISDFEPITAWAARFSDTKCIALSHQASFLSDKTPRPERKSPFAEGVLRYFAPCDFYFGTHYREYDDFIESPILREEILQLMPTLGEHVTVYLPAYSTELLTQIFYQLPEVRWEIFSPGCEHPQTVGNVSVFPIGNETFLKSLESSLGLLCSAGFEGPSEAMYLNKKLMVLPIDNQYEQLCNAAAVKELGGEVVLKVTDRFVHQLKNWIEHGKNLELKSVCNVKDLALKVLSAGTSL